MVLFPLHPMGYHIPILQLVLLGMVRSLFHPTTCHLHTLLVDMVLSLFQLWEWHTPILLLVIMLSPFQLTIRHLPIPLVAMVGRHSIPRGNGAFPFWWDHSCMGMGFPLPILTLQYHPRH